MIKARNRYMHELLPVCPSSPLVAGGAFLGLPVVYARESVSGRISVEWQGRAWEGMMNQYLSRSILGPEAGLFARRDNSYSLFCSDSGGHCCRAAV
jgi:hypothetical protein